MLVIDRCHTTTGLVCLVWAFDLFSVGGNCQWDVALHCLTSFNLIFCIQWDSCTEKMHPPFAVQMANLKQSCSCAKHTIYIWWQDVRMWCSAWHCPYHTRRAWRVKGINKKLTEVFKLKQIGLKWPTDALLHSQNISVSKGTDVESEIDKQGDHVWLIWKGLTCHFIQNKEPLKITAQ